MVRVVACLVLVAACGRFGFDPVAGDDDSGVGPSVFEALATPEGGETWALQMSPTNVDVLYVIAGGRVYRSENRGGSWSDCGRPDVAWSLLVDPDDPDILYVGDQTGLERSTDGCASWEQLASVPKITALAWVGDEIVLGAFGLWRYSPGAVTQIPSAADGLDIEFIAANGTTIIVTTTEAGVFRSIDAGATFAPSNTGLPAVPASGVVFPIAADASIVLVQGDSGAFRSTDGGASWAAISGGGDGRDAIAADPSDPSYVLSSSWRGMLRSYNGGQMFDGTNPRTANMNSAYVAAFAFDPSGRTYASTARGMFAAPDHDLAWGPIMTGMNAWDIESLARVPGQGLIYASTASGVLRSADNGRTWAISSAGMEGKVSGLQTVHVPEDRPDELWTAGANFLWRSTDGGLSFTETHSVNVTDAWQILVIRSHGEELWFATGTRIWRSLNGGVNWTQHLIADDERDINDLLIDRAGGVWAATSDGLFHSTSGGTTFVASPVPSTTPAVTALALDGDGTLIAGTYDGVFARSPATGTWTSAGLATADVYGTLVHEGRWIAATESGVRYSDDQGVTWRVLPGLEALRPRSLLIDDDGRLLVGTRGYGLHRAALP